jgi:8-oxo-dGTP pyrophosphatase MutT (NUDIX family)
MSYRAAILLIENDRLAVIERHRPGADYYTFPGGHVDPGETPEQAAVREAMEELGLQVELLRQVAVVWWQGRPQYHYLARCVGGEFGTGCGEELHNADPHKGSYKPVWLPLSELPGKRLLPLPVAELVLRSLTEGWPDPAPVIHE